MKVKAFRTTLVIVGILILLLGVFLDPIRGRAFEFGPSNFALTFLGISFLILGIPSSIISNIEHNRLFRESMVFLGTILIIGGLNISILLGEEEISLFGTILLGEKEILVIILIFPLLILGTLLLFSSLYFANKSSDMKGDHKSPSNHKGLTYRPEIDGLRALAVIPVILYHLKIGGFEGGFVGVDVFFVISGFLITSIIYREMENNTFSLANFYERRIRRIFPALFLVLFSVLLIGNWLLDPDTFKDLGSAIFATTFFTSNFLLRNQAGYFDKAAELKPLLHTWSLAIEEQFYIFFPLLFLILFRLFKKYFKAVLVLIAVASFVLSQVWLSKDPSVTFYLIQHRAWELLLGSILAVGVLPEINHKFMKNLLGILGIILILFAVFTFSLETPFPGAMALLPTLGAFLIIYSGNGEENLAASILSLKPLVFTGKISYSLYLWHWVLIVLARYYNILPLNAWQNLLVIISTFTVSTLAWKFVENPFRNKEIFNRRVILSFGVFITLLTGVVGFSIFRSDGLPNRFAPLPVYGASDNLELKDCILRQSGLEITDPKNSIEYEEFEKKICHMGPKDLPVSFVIMGDSHLKALSFALDNLSNEMGIHGIVFFSVDCPPVLNIIHPQRPYCKPHNDFVFEYLSNHTEIKKIFFVGRWSIWANGLSYKKEEKEPIYISLSNQPQSFSAENNVRLLTESLDFTFTEIEKNGQQIIFVNDVPEVGYPVRENFFVAMNTDRDINDLIAPTFEEFNDRYQPIFNILENLKIKHPSIKEINTYAPLCDSSNCYVEKDGYHLYTDEHHLSVFGALLVAEEFRETFENIKP